MGLLEWLSCIAYHRPFSCITGQSRIMWQVVHPTIDGTGPTCWRALSIKIFVRVRPLWGRKARSRKTIWVSSCSELLLVQMLFTEHCKRLRFPIEISMFYNVLCDYPDQVLWFIEPVLLQSSHIQWCLLWIGNLLSFQGLHHRVSRTHGHREIRAMLLWVQKLFLLMICCPVHSFAFLTGRLLLSFYSNSSNNFKL